MARDSHKLYDHKSSKKTFPGERGGSEPHERERGGGDASMSQLGAKKEAAHTAGRGEPTLDKGREEAVGHSNPQHYERAEKREARREPSERDAAERRGSEGEHEMGGKHEIHMRHHTERKEMHERHHKERMHQREEHALQHENMAERHATEEDKMGQRHLDELGVGEEASGAPMGAMGQAAQTAGAGQVAPQAGMGSGNQPTGI